MNKYFLLLITSFASLSLNAAEGQSGKQDEWTFTEKGTVKGRTQAEAITTNQKYYILDNTNTGEHIFFQIFEGAVNRRVCLKLDANGRVHVMQPYDAGIILALCEKNEKKFQVTKTK